MTTKGKHLNDFEHCRLRPDTYVGSVKTINRVTRVFDNETKSIISKEIKYNPGLIRIIIEIISNAIDNKWTSEKLGIDCKKISINLDRETGEISVENDGAFISADKETYEYNDPITQKTTKNELYPAELYFGYMKAGTNYNDDDQKKSSGRNGLGSKATNALSSKFTVEHTDPVLGKKFVQVFTNGAKERTKPKLTACKAKNGYTRISFIPDYEYFGYPGIDDDLYDLVHKFAYDTAMITGLIINFNNEKIICKDLLKYVKLFYSNKENNLLSFKTESGDECVIVEVPPEDNIVETKDVQQVSFVNGISTADGGVHVDVWKNAIFPPLVRLMNERPKKTLKTSAKQLYPNFVLFVRCEIDWVKPSFDSQTKERLNAPEPPVCKITKEELEKMLKWNFVSRIDEYLEFNAERNNIKNETKEKRVSLGDSGQHANWYGTKKADQCTFFITEGKSARTWVLKGIGKIENGSDRYGVAAIRGKFKNSLKSTDKALLANEEIKMIRGALNLRGPRTKSHPRGVIDYSLDENFKTLYYQKKVCILTDADDDGIHIRGLLFNFFRDQYPTLWDRNYFEFMSTPVVKIFKSESALNKKPECVFYSTQDYQDWVKSKDFKKSYYPRYFKGLGTMSDKDAIDAFKELSLVQMKLRGDDDDLLQMAFGKKAEGRKEWMLKALPELQDIDDYIEDVENNGIVEKISAPYVYKGEYTLAEFVQNQLLIYEIMTLSRAIPSVFDGFKESTRKITFGMFLENQTKLLAVEKLAGKISENIAYHHAPKALADAIIKMIQGFVGSNNLPLLKAVSQTGTRLEGGKDAPAARYPETALDPIARIIFDKRDEPLLDYVFDDGKTVEPTFYVPLLPMVLVNGAEGVATGWSTKVPAYNPVDLVKWIRNYINGEENTERLIPWYRGFKGKIVPLISKESGNITSFVSKGILTKNTKGDWWTISEAPVGLWTYNLKDYIETELMLFDEPTTKRKAAPKKTTAAAKKKETTKKDKKCVLDIAHYSTGNSVHIEIKPAKDFTPDMNEKGNFDILKKGFSMKNMILLNEKGYPMKFNSAEEIIERFAKYRLYLYRKRKDYWTKQYEKELQIIKNKIKYIDGVSTGKINLRQSDKDVETELLTYGLLKFDGTFEHLLSMQTRSMTENKIKELEKEANKIEEQYLYYKNTSPGRMWEDDLDVFEKEYEKFLERRADADA